MICKEELLQSIKPGMDLTKDFASLIYGYEISYPGFSDQAIAALERSGCTQAREFYEAVVHEYEQQREKALKNVASSLYRQQATGGKVKKNGQRTGIKQKWWEYSQY